METRIKQSFDAFFRRDDSRSQWRFYLGLGIVAGLGAVALHSAPNCRWRELSAGILLAGASLFLGILIGFLFGIPKTSKASPDSNSSAAAPPGVSYSLNTNLEDISDWLTKMLVGVGLVQLRSMPGFIRRISAYWERSVGREFPAAYVATVILFFFAVGFLIGYLWTRLALTVDFIAQDPRRLINGLIDDIAQKAKNDPNISIRSADQQVVTSQELQTAEAVAKISSASSISLDDLRNQIGILAAKYDSIRATMPSGDNRTREMEIVASQLRGYALAAYQLLPEYTQSDSAGKRLAAIAFLQIRPDPKYYGWLELLFETEAPFLQYHAAVALRNAAKQATSPEQKEAVRQSCEEAVRHLTDWSQAHDDPTESDRMRVLKEALKMLGS